MNSFFFLLYRRLNLHSWQWGEEEEEVEEEASPPIPFVRFKPMKTIGKETTALHPKRENFPRSFQHCRINIVASTGLKRHQYTSKHIYTCWLIEKFFSLFFFSFFFLCCPTANKQVFFVKQTSKQNIILMLWQRCVRTWLCDLGRVSFRRRWFPFRCFIPPPAPPLHPHHINNPIG